MNNIINDLDQQTLMPRITMDGVMQRCRELEAENDKLKDEVARLNILLSNKILVVEDGSVDIDRLEEDGFYVIGYRQGARPPMWLDKGE